MFALVCYGYLMLFEYILRIKIKSKYANEDNFNLFLNGPNFTRNGIIILVPLIKAIFLQVTHQKDISFSSLSMNIRESDIAKVLILATQIILPLVLQNNYSLNARNLRGL